MPCTWTVYLLVARRLLNHCTPHTSTAGKAWGLAMVAFQGQTSTAASHPFVERMARVFEGNRIRSKQKILNRDLNKGSKSFRAQLRLVRDEVMKKISLCWLFPIFSSFSLIVKYAPQSSVTSLSSQSSVTSPSKANTTGAIWRWFFEWRFLYFTLHPCYSRICLSRWLHFFVFTNEKNYPVSTFTCLWSF